MFYQRWSKAKECLLVLRQSGGSSQPQRDIRMQPPSIVAPSVPPRPPTPPRNHRIVKKLSSRPPTPPRSQRPLKRLSLKPPMPPRSNRIVKKLSSVPPVPPRSNRVLKQLSLKPPKPSSSRIRKKLSQEPQRSMNVNVCCNSPNKLSSFLEH
nr:myelin-associated oligodendrocyte basic protein-like isoform X2 [Cherax quadricarinatus]